MRLSANILRLAFGAEHFLDQKSYAGREIMPFCETRSFTRSGAESAGGRNEGLRKSGCATPYLHLLATVVNRSRCSKGMMVIYIRYPAAAEGRDRVVRQ